MNLISFARSLTRRVAAVAVVLSAAGTSQAADTPLPAAPAALLLPAAAPCATCAAPAGAPCAAGCTVGKACPTCIPGRYKPAFQTKLCPGACFGYFQTQWSKWDEVCPLPYQGQGFSDAPAQRTTPVTPVRPPAGGSDPKKSTDTKKDAETKKDTDPKFNKDTKGSELPPPRPGAGATPMGRGNNLPTIPQAPNTLPIPTGRFGS